MGLRGLQPHHGRSGNGGHDLTGNPMYQGGSSPTTLAGYALATPSVGYHRAEDGTSMGT